MAVVFVQGASKGLGLQFTKVLAARPNIHQVIATSRKAEQSDSLLELRHNFPTKVHIQNLDVTKEEEIKYIVPSISQLCNGKVDLLINCSAILHPSGRGETSLRDVSSQV